MEEADFLIHTTIRIETTTSEGICTGTGFFYTFFHDNTNGSIPVIVTNKHVVKGAINGKLIFSLSDKNGNVIDGEFLQYEIDNFQKAWIMHPSDDIDLCILLIAPIHNELKEEGYGLYYTSLVKTNIPTDEQINVEFSKIEEVTIVGYPDGLWDDENNIPITRRGITATPIQIDFRKTPKFLIDASIFGGSSGSPVFIFDEGAYSGKNNAIIYRKRLNLIGIVYAVAQHTVTGDINFIDIPAYKSPIAVTKIPNNLGVVIKASKLFDFEEILLKK